MFNEMNELIPVSCCVIQKGQVSQTELPLVQLTAARFFLW